MPTAPRIRTLATTLISLALAATATPAAAKPYTLAELLDLAGKQNPGLAAAAQQTEAVRAQLLEANRSWLPSGELTSLLAPAPTIRCVGVPGASQQQREENCLATNVGDPGFRNASIGGIFTRTELRLVQPVYTFGKISAGVLAAESGIAASRSREQGVAADLSLNVRRAYWGLKLARELLETVNEGRSRVEDGRKTLEKEIASGDASPVDRHRIDTLRAEVEVRVLEARKLAELAVAGLRALIGPDAPEEIEVDAQPLTAVVVQARTLAHYQQQARESRPEVRALEHLVAAKRSLADLERRKLYPDVVVVATATAAFASSIDNPRNAFYADPFNTFSGGIGAALRMPLDLFVKNARAHRVHAEAEEAFHRRREALAGIGFEVTRAYGEMTESRERMTVLATGEKAGRQWINATAQKFAIGLAEPKDFVDALLAYFQFRARHLQAIYDFNFAAAQLGRAVGTQVFASDPQK